jgi:hypothetical protein
MAARTNTRDLKTLRTRRVEGTTTMRRMRARMQE